MPRKPTNDQELLYYQQLRGRVLDIMQEHGYHNNPKAFAEHINVDYSLLYNFISERTPRPQFILLHAVLNAFPGTNLNWFYGIYEEESLFGDYKPGAIHPSMSQEELLSRNQKADNLILKLLDENNQLKDKVIKLQDTLNSVLSSIKQIL